MSRAANVVQTSLTRMLVRLHAHLSRRRRAQLVMLGILMLVGAMAELVTIGAVLPFLALIADPANASQLPVLGVFFARLGFEADEMLMPVTLLFIGVAIAAAIVRLVLTWASQKFVFRLGHDIGVKVYLTTLYQPYSYHLARNSSQLIADINKVQLVVGGMLMPLMHAITAIIISAFILTALVIIDAATALTAALAFGVLYFSISFATRWRLRINSKIIAAAQSERVKTVQEGLGGIRDVLLDQAQPVYVQKFVRIDSAFRNAQTINAFIGAAPRFVIEATGMVLIALLAAFLSRGPGGLSAALPVLGALALGAARLLPLFQQIYNGWTQVAGNRHNLQDLLEVLELPLSRPVPGESPLAFEKSIVFDKVSFRYQPDEEIILREIDFVVPKGARVGIIGKTGSGKSTLMDLLMGLLVPSEGRILIDGQALTGGNVARWQARIAHVPQSIYLSDATIAENIAFAVADGKIDRERMRQAARQAAIADFIENLPDQYDTMVGERGVRLSGGQRQRIGIARALYRRADVLVFDEATSALDSLTETAVMDAVASLGRELTIFIIAHRTSTLDGCDLIVKLEGGKVESVTAEHFAR